MKKNYVLIVCIVANLSAFSAFGMEQKIDMPVELHKATTNGNLDHVKELIELGCPVDCILNDQTPLFKALFHKHYDVAKYLIEQGANVNTECSHYKETPFLYACLGSSDFVKFVLDHGGDTSLTTAAKNTILHTAAACDLDYLAQIALIRGTPVNVQNDEGETPLHRAAESNSKNVFLTLLVAHADPNLANNDGEAPIHIIARKGHLELLNYLSETKTIKANFNQSVAKSKLALSTLPGATPLHIAAHYAQLEILKKILVCGVTIAQLGHKKRTALHYAALKGYDGVFSSLQADDSHVPTVQYLLERELNPNMKDKKGNTALHITVKKNHTAIIPLLLQYGARTDIKNKKGKTALDLAQENNVDLK